MACGIGGLSADGVRHILKARLTAAGYPPGFASPHGLRAGFLTQAALDGAPIQASNGIVHVIDGVLSPVDVLNSTGDDKVDFICRQHLADAAISAPDAPEPAA